MSVAARSDYRAITGSVCIEDDEDEKGQNARVTDRIRTSRTRVERIIGPCSGECSSAPNSVRTSACQPDSNVFEIKE